MAEQAETRSIGDILRQMDREAEAAGDEVPEEVTPEKAEPAPEPPMETPAEPAPEPEPESVDRDSLADLAAHIGVEVADLYRLKIPLSGLWFAWEEPLPRGIPAEIKGEVHKRESLKEKMSPDWDPKFD